MAPVFAVLLYVVTGTAGGLIKRGPPPVSDAPVSVVLLPGPIHTDFVIPLTADVRRRFDFVQGVHDPAVGWLIIGWGAQGFYMQTPTYRELRPATIAKAVTGDHAVLRVEPLSGRATLSQFPKLALTQAQFDQLIEGIAHSFASKTPYDHAGWTGKDQFYPAKGRFDLFRTCNVWVGQMLRQAGVRVGVWTPFVWSF